jgi:hypothetical protein
MPNPVTITFKDGFDWEMLAKQKEELIEASLDLYPNFAGIVEIIDVIQDEAEKAGHPVVFLTEDDDE